MTWHPLISLTSFLKDIPSMLSTSAIPCPSNSLGTHLLQHMARRMVSSQNILPADIPMAYLHQVYTQILSSSKDYPCSSFKLISFHPYPLFSSLYFYFWHSTYHHLSYSMFYVHLFFVFIKLSINPVDKMIFITFLKKIHCLKLQYLYQCFTLLNEHSEPLFSTFRQFLLLEIKK